MKWRDVPAGYRDRLASLRTQLHDDPYKVLGISESATDAEVKSAYRRQAATYHPDKQGAFLRSYAEEVMKIVNSAYERIRSLRGL